jgi:hypothetical protein
VDLAKTPFPDGTDEGACLEFQYARFDAREQRFKYGNVDMVLDLGEELKLLPKDANDNLNLMACSLPVVVGRQRPGIEYGESEVVQR